MTEYRRKGCKVNFKNSQDEISIQLIFTKKDKDVDIRDFFRKIMEIPGIEVHFKKGRYELIARGQENLLEKVPKVMENFQHFYDNSFGGRTLDNTNANFVERQSEAQKKSGNYSGYSYDGSALTQSRLHEEKMTQTESHVGSLGSANTFKHDKGSSLQNSDNDGIASVHGSNIKTTGTMQGIEQHNTQPREAWVKELPNDKPERDEELDEKKKDLHDRATMTGSGDGEQAEGKRTSHDDDDDDNVADDDSYAHKSNNENTGIAQGSGGRYESKGLNVNSDTTDGSVMHENDEADGNGDRAHTVNTKVKPRDANKGRGENSNAEEQSK